MTLRVLVLTIFSFSALLFSYGPVNADQGDPCTNNSQCSSGEYCHPQAHICLPQPAIPTAPPDLPPILEQGVTNETFDAVNPLKLADSPFADDLSTPGGIMSRVLFFAFPIAGLILFVMIVWGGFEILAGANEKKSLDAGKQRVTAALVGFLLLFASYWIAQIIEFIFGIVIL